MASEKGSGSILFKLLILVAFVALVVVIIIPGRIWDEEKSEKETAQYNMASIFEAEKVYHRITKKYTTDKAELLSVVKADSTIKKTESLVAYTQDLKVAVEDYLNVPTIRSLYIINENLVKISTDFDDNEKYFKGEESLISVAPDLKMAVNELLSGSTYPTFIQSAFYVDSLYQLRRDLTDYNLQAAAQRASHLTEGNSSVLSNIELSEFNSTWPALAEKLNDFRKAIEATPIVKETSVAARIREFASKVSGEVTKLGLTDFNADVAKTNELNEKIAGLYASYLTDYSVTIRQAQFRLSAEDEMVLNLNEQTFISPVNNDAYKIIISDDSSDIKVESPVLLADLVERTTAIVEKIEGFEFVNHYTAYLDTLNKIQQKGLDIKTKVRRNIDITIKNKEIEDKINKFKSGSEYNSANDLKEFVEVVKNGQSYSAIKESITKARDAISIFKQIYSENLFNNVDSIHVGMLKDITEFNTVLGKVRRLPRSVEKFENEEAQLNQILENIKQKSASTDAAQLDALSEELKVLFEFASNGENQNVYGVFEKKIENFGYVNNSQKSWEEESE